MQFRLWTIPFLLFSLFISEVGFAATAILLDGKPVSYLKSYSSKNSLFAPRKNNYQLHKIRDDVDFHNRVHSRFQQTYDGYPIIGAEIILHEKNSKSHSPISLSGKIYERLEEDLVKESATVFNEDQKSKAIQIVKNYFPFFYQKESAERCIYIDSQHKAHYVFFVSLYGNDGNTGAKHMKAIVDGETLRILESWNSIHAFDYVSAGGFGGNEKIGKFTYDGNVSLDHHFMPLVVERIGDELYGTCYLRNQDVIIFDAQYGLTTPYFSCRTQVVTHSLFWPDANDPQETDSVNGAYSPNNDALYLASSVKRMYQEEYGVTLRDQNGQSMKIKIITHYGRNFEGAYWDNENNTITIGDGGKNYYPLVSLGILAHEISHALTYQYSNLSTSQSLPINESFSDMAAQAAEYYIYGQNTWQIGAEIKKDNTARRYMDEPKKDGVSIDHLKDFNIENNMDPHLAAGIFNKAFYLLATTPKWNTKKAFDLVLQANLYYWRSDVNFTEAACGVAQVASDHNYIDEDRQAIENAFSQVGIYTKEACVY